MKQYQLKLKKQSKISNKHDLAKLIGSKGIQVFYNFVRLGPRVILRSAFQLLRVNIVTRLLSAIFLIFFDCLSLFQRRISFKQFIIDVGLALMLLIGGTLGWYMGMGAIERIFVENAVLGILAGMVGAGVFSSLLGTLWEKFVTLFVQDDATKILQLLNRHYNDLLVEYDISEAEATRLTEAIHIDKKLIRHLYASSDKEKACREVLLDRIQKPQDRS